jgi:hypothetical protein
MDPSMNLRPFFTFYGGKWRGQVIVCENVGATWLPFRPWRRIRSAHGFSHEAIWIKELAPPMAECGSCRGYGHFNEKTGKPSVDRLGRKCLDCRGEGKVPA